MGAIDFLSIKNKHNLVKFEGIHMKMIWHNQDQWIFQ